MRFLHTADWHVGKSLRGRSRHDEQSQALEEILDIARRGNIDFLLHAGDIFDSFTPPAEAEKLVFHFFAELAGLKIPAVIIGGNHDHPQRLEALQPLFQHMSMHVRWKVLQPDDGGVVNLICNDECARIAMLPFVPEHKLVSTEQLMQSTPGRFTEYADRMADIVDYLCAGFSADTVNILAGHLFVLDSQPSGSERVIHLTKPYAMAAPRFPATASYMAFGHLHRPQQIPAPSPAYYSGSVLQMDFGEEGQAKRVILVDAAPRKTARVESIPLTSGRRLRSVFAPLLELQRRQSDWDNGDLLRVTIQTERPQLGLADKVREMLPNAIDIRLQLPEAEAAAHPEPLRSLSPLQIFERFYYERNHCEPEGALRNAFNSLYEETSRAPR